MIKKGFFLLLYTTMVLFAGTATFKGYVVDESGNALAGTNIILKETLQGIATDKDGYFILKVQDGT